MWRKMKNTGCNKIAILDDNIFFATGLKFFIEQYSHKNGISVSVQVLPAFQFRHYEWSAYTVIFISLRNFHGSPLICHALLYPPPNLVIVKNCVHRINESSLYTGFQAIYRNQPVSEINSFLRRFIPSADRQIAGPLCSLHRDAGLSERERHTAMMLASGLSLTDIAKVLNISVKTVSSHKKNNAQTQRDEEYRVISVAFDPVIVVSVFDLSGEKTVS